MKIIYLHHKCFNFHHHQTSRTPNWTSLNKLQVFPLLPLGIKLLKHNILDLDFCTHFQNYMKLLHFHWA